MGCVPLPAFWVVLTFGSVEVGGTWVGTRGFLGLRLADEGITGPFVGMVYKAAAIRSVWRTCLSGVRRLPVRIARFQGLVLAVILLGSGPLSAEAETTPWSSAKAAVDAGQSRGAIDQLRAWVETEPSLAEARYWYGRALLGSGRVDESVAELQQAVALDPSHADAYAWLGNAFGGQARDAGLIKAMGLVKDMRGAWDRALALDPDNVSARAGYFHFYLFAPSIGGGSLEMARDQIPRIAKAEPQLARLMEAQVLRKAEDAAGAEAILRVLVQEAPTLSEAWIALGDLLLDGDRAQEAFEVYKVWAATRAGDNLAHFFLGRAAAISGLELEAGEAALRRYQSEPALADLAPPEAAVEARLGQILLAQGNRSGARERFEQALKLDPDNRVARDGLRRTQPAVARTR